MKAVRLPSPYCYGWYSEPHWKRGARLSGTWFYQSGSLAHYITHVTTSLHDAELYVPSGGVFMGVLTPTAGMEGFVKCDQGH